MKTKYIKMLFALLVSFWVWFLPPSLIGLSSISIVEQRLLAIFAFAIIMWVTEAIPTWTTSILVLVIILLTSSDYCLIFLREGYDALELGTLVSYRSLMATFGEPTIMLFLGGLVLAIALTRCGIDTRIAKFVVKPFGDRSEMVLLGFMIMTTIISMFISNTATAALMLAIVTPIVRAMPSEKNGNTALILSIPIAANIGGIGTPIGTLPNVYALSYLNSEKWFNLNIGFLEWTLYMLPIVSFLIFISWLLLTKFFPFRQRHISFDIPQKITKKRDVIIVYITFFVMILLWIFDVKLGVNIYIVGMLPIAIFSFAGIIGREEIKSINWDVLWLVVGSFALGVSFNETGLARHAIEAIPFHQWHPFLIIVGAGLLCYFISLFMSNTATAGLLMPILGVIAMDSGDSLNSFGGPAALIIGIAVSSSLAMVFPFSTPSNAMAYSMGHFTQGQMAKVGFIIGFIGLIITYCLLAYLGSSIIALV